MRIRLFPTTLALGAALLAGAALISTAGAVQASGPCADPNNNCPNNGQVTFTSGGNGATGSGSGAAAQSGPSISVDPGAGAIGDTVTVSGQGFAAGGRGSIIFINLVTPDGGTVEMRNDGDPLVYAGNDGSFSADVVVPAKAQQGRQQVCVNSLVTAKVCTPFTVAGGAAPQPNSGPAANPQSVAGHYQCSSMLLVGFGSQWCTGSEPVLALYADGTYSFGDASGSYSYDGSQVSFDGGAVIGTVQNRTLRFEITTDAGTVRYTYIRMDY